MNGLVALVAGAAPAELVASARQRPRGALRGAHLHKTDPGAASRTAPTIGSGWLGGSWALGSAHWLSQAAGVTVDDT